MFRNNGVHIRVTTARGENLKKLLANSQELIINIKFILIKY